MQVSELDLHNLKKICVYLKKENIKALYFADSLGALEIKKFKKINEFLKKYWNKDLGLHAHDNLNLALKNSEYAIKNNFRWIDSTIMGMGRGPGNLKTEEIIKKLNKNQVLIINKLKNRYFNKLKQKYKWGTNKYYREAAKKKIHPTYIQNMLADIKYRKKDYETILKSLANEDAKKFNPHRLFLSSNIYNKLKKGKWSPSNELTGKNILILGPGQNAKKNKNKLIKFIKTKNLYVIVLNTVDHIPEMFINLRAICHPTTELCHQVMLPPHVHHHRHHLMAQLSKMAQQQKKMLWFRTSPLLS